MTNNSSEKKNTAADQKTPSSVIQPEAIQPEINHPEIIQPAWCDRPSIQVAPDLIGCTLIRQLPDGPRIRCTIVETEAYAPGDPACHAYSGQSKRNAAMFGPPGRSYVYLIYGMYHCLNVVTETEGIGSAVLIRALELDTIPPHLTPKQTEKPHRIAAGPGKLCRALKVNRDLDGVLYHPENRLWLEHRSQTINNEDIIQTTRIGITKAADRPWRWFLNSSRAVSKK